MLHRIAVFIIYRLSVIISLLSLWASVCVNQPSAVRAESCVSLASDRGGHCTMTRLCQMGMVQGNNMAVSKKSHFCLLVVMTFRGLKRSTRSFTRGMETLWRQRCEGYVCLRGTKAGFCCRVLRYLWNQMRNRETVYTGEKQTSRSAWREAASSPWVADLRVVRKQIQNACGLILFCLDLHTLYTSQVESDWVFWNSHKASACFASTSKCPGNPAYSQG